MKEMLILPSDDQKLSFIQQVKILPVFLREVFFYPGKASEVMPDPEDDTKLKVTRRELTDADRELLGRDKERM
jgi:hypothetical protein